MEYILEQALMPMLHFTLDEGESIVSESGAMLFMDDSIEMDAHMRGGVLQGLSRTVVGESFFLNRFRAEKDKSKITLGINSPGKILDFEISGGGAVLCQKTAFLACTEGITLKSKLQKKFVAGLLGGEGFFVQEISGEGYAFLEFSGDIIKKELSAGERLLVDSNCIAAFDPSVSYDVEFMRGGVKNALFSGEGLFIVRLEGPGMIYLQNRSIFSVMRSVLPIGALSKLGKH